MHLLSISCSFFLSRECIASLNYRFYIAYKKKIIIISLKGYLKHCPNTSIVDVLIYS